MSRGSSHRIFAPEARLLARRLISACGDAPAHSTGVIPIVRKTTTIQEVVSLIFIISPLFHLVGSGSLQDSARLFGSIVVGVNADEDAAMLEVFVIGSS